MNAQQLIEINTRRHVLGLGYTEEEAADAAAVIVERYKRNQFAKATDFLDDAAKYVRQQFGKPGKKA